MHKARIWVFIIIVGWPLFSMKFNSDRSEKMNFVLIFYPTPKNIHIAFPFLCPLFYGFLRSFQKHRSFPHNCLKRTKKKTF